MTATRDTVNCQEIGTKLQPGMVCEFENVGPGMHRHVPGLLTQVQADEVVAELVHEGLVRCAQQVKAVRALLDTYDTRPPRDNTLYHAREFVEAVRKELAR